MIRNKPDLNLAWTSRNHIRDRQKRISDINYNWDRLLNIFEPGIPTRIRQPPYNDLSVAIDIRLRTFRSLNKPGDINV